MKEIILIVGFILIFSTLALAQVQHHPLSEIWPTDIDRFSVGI